jgi:acyl-coenzyme A thioesterase PaaI-like protein
MRKQPNSHNCFICGMQNGAGLKVAFYDTVDAAGRPELVARFIGRHPHQGYPGRMHGGIATGVLDEVIGRAINAGRTGDVTWGVATGLDARFRQPVPLDVELTARGRITRDRSRMFEGTGEIYLPDGTVAVSATASYFKMPLEAISDVDPEALGWRVYEDESEHSSEA